MFWTALRPLLSEDESALQQFDIVREGFSDVMDKELERMWTRNLVFQHMIPRSARAVALMVRTKVDYTIFFRQLANMPDELSGLKKEFLRAHQIARR